MSIPAFLSFTKNSVTVHYECPTNPNYVGLEYKPGSNLLEFLFLDADLIQKEYEEIVPTLISGCLSDSPNAWHNITKHFNYLDRKYTFIFFYNHFLFSRFYDAQSNSQIIFEEFELIDYKNAVADKPLSSEKNKRNLKIFFEYTIKMIMTDIMRKKDAIATEIERIYNHSQNDTFMALTPSQRLFYLDKSAGSNYFTYTNSNYRERDSSYSVSLVPKNLIPLPKFMSDKDYAQLISKEDFELVEAYKVSDIKDWLKLEFYKLIMFDFNFSKCKYCNNFYIVYFRKDIKYCDRIKKGESAPCSEIGSSRLYHQKSRDNDVFGDFVRAYKRRHARVRTNKLSQDEFFLWSIEAQKKRQECLDGKISIDEFNQWLGNKKVHKE